MTVALLYSLIALTANGPVHLTEIVQTKDVGMCKNVAYWARNDKFLEDEVGVPRLIGCFGYGYNSGLPRQYDYMEAHQCDVHPVFHTFDEVTGLLTGTYVCRKP